MNIYTVTYLINNYGSILQAYALQKRLRELGGNPVIIRKEAPGKGSFIYSLWAILRPQKHYSLFQRIKKEKQKKKFYIKNSKISHFINTYLSVTDINDIERFKRNVSESDVFLAGSDQIWNVLNSTLSSWYSLQWMDSKKKYSYAASIGLDKLTELQNKLYFDGLAEFQTISLRESQAVKLLTPLFKGKNVRQDLDPTLLFDGSFWRKMESERLIKEPYVFVYMLRPDMNVIELAKQVAKKKGNKVIYTGLYSDKMSGVTTICDAGVEEFLSYIDNAEAVITNSFHGTVFSVLFNKPFLSVKLETTSSRVESFLSMTGLESRLVEAPCPRNSIPEVDYERVEHILELERKKSLDYLAKICGV